MADVFGEFNSLHFDILKEIGNMGAGNAVSSLAKLLNIKVDMTVPKVSILEFKDVSDALGDPEQLIVGVLVRISGDVNGIMMFLVRTDACKLLISNLIGQQVSPGDDFDELELSAAGEIGNILAGAYISALASFINKRILPAPPSTAIDMTAAILSVPAIEFGKIGDRVLFIESVFEATKDGDISGYFILVPDYDSMKVVLTSLGVE